MSTSNPKKHHFVPQLYMRNFSTDTTRKLINIFAITQDLAIKEKAIKDQCYAWRLYGNTNEIEDNLQRFESPLAEVLRCIIANCRLPRPSTDERRKLYEFISLQMLRTAREATRLSDGMEEMFGHVRKSFSPNSSDIVTKSPLSKYSLMSLQTWPMVLDAIDDLAIKLIINRTNIQLITSDNPAVRYNQYCEGVEGLTTTGMLSQGLQVLLPISPRHLLLFYDANAYSVAGHSDPVVVTDRSGDILTLNLLQGINAGEILLFSDFEQLDLVKNAVKSAIQLRRFREPQVKELVDDADPRHRTLMHLYWNNVDIKLNLSFMSVKRRARRISMEYRMNLYRTSNKYGREINRIRATPNGILRRFRLPSEDGK
jgi:hypothetical protein